MAQKLHDTYNYSYDNLKVLLGGWNTWKQENAKDANAYPIETGPGSKVGQQDSGPGGPIQPGLAATAEVKQSGAGKVVPTAAPAITPKP